jgi:hypothetical protein
MPARPARAALAALVPLLWTAPPSAAQCPGVLSQARHDLSAASVGNVALFAGGNLSGSDAVSDVVDLWDATTGTWSTATLSVARARPAAVVSGSLAFFAGGYRVNSNFGYIGGYDAVDVYDAATGTWSTAQLSRGRWGLAAAAAGTQVLFVGGSRTNGPPFPPVDTIDIHDVATGQWSTAALGVPRTRLAATSVGNVALFAGGYHVPSQVPVPLAAVDLYDASTGQWSTASLSVARYDLSATSVGPVALFAGGIAANGVSAAVDLWDATTGQWSTATLSQPRVAPAAFTVGGYAVFAGGNADLSGGAPSATVDVYELATGTWTSTTLSTQRMAADAAVAGGIALVGGGFGPAGDEASVERLPGLLADFFAPGTGCPCANDGTSGAGCANSTGTGGVLTPDCAGGFAASALVPGQPAVLLAGTTAGPSAPFGDGFLALGGSIRRLAARTADASGGATWPLVLAATPPGPPWTGGAFRSLQVWYRDPASPCGSGVNLSNGLRAIVW